MTGTLRFVLAALVLANHVWLPVMNKVGAHAVIVFYTISGYLMAMILAETYVGVAGIPRYLANRFLRIFPAYWLVALSTALLLVLLPDTFNQVYSSLHLPGTADLWVANLTLYGMIHAPIALVPPAWSLSVECFFYIVIGLGLSWSRWTTLAWFLASLAYTIHLNWIGAPISARYTPVDAASMFFSTGALIYHVRPLLLSLRIPRGAWLALLALFCLFPVLVEVAGGDRFMLGYYGAYALGLVLLIAAINADLDRRSSIDAYFGSLSYPVFLSHLFALGLVRLLTFGRVERGGLVELLLTLFVTCLIAVAMVRYFDPSIDRLRNVIRPSRGSVLPSAMVRRSA